MDNNKKKDEQLGMNHGTAAHQLRKRVMFRLMQKCGEDVCFQCGEKIETFDNLSVEHKVPWLDNDPALFWDLDNIAFSHLSCNIGAGRKMKPLYKHGTDNCYSRYKCRCDDCKKAHSIRLKKNRTKHAPLV